MEKKFLVVGVAVWLILLVARTWPTGPAFLNSDYMNYLIQEYGEGYVVGTFIGEIIIILLISYGASWLWTKTHSKKQP